MIHMSKVILSVCSRIKSPGSSLGDLRAFVGDFPEDSAHELNLIMSWDSNSIYEGHKQNLFDTREDDEILVLCHDDVSILSNYQDFFKYLDVCKKPGVGIVGVAGCTTLNNRAVWWESRQTNQTRGFVFQSNNAKSDPNLTMQPNYFGVCGQVVALDGCFMAATVGTWRKVGLDKPKYLTSNWDFYDIHLSLTAHLMGLNNYVVPIIVRHGSEGQMRKEWYEAQAQFIREHSSNLPCILSKGNTSELPN